MIAGDLGGGCWGLTMLMRGVESGRKRGVSGPEVRCSSRRRVNCIGSRTVSCG